MGCLYILEVNPLPVASFAKIFLPFCGLSFHFVNGLLCCVKPPRVMKIKTKIKKKMEFWCGWNKQKERSENNVSEAS